MNAVTTLIFLDGPDTRSALCAPALVDAMQRLATCSDVPLANVAAVYLVDICGLAAPRHDAPF